MKDERKTKLIEPTVLLNTQEKNPILLVLSGYHAEIFDINDKLTVGRNSPGNTVDVDLKEKYVSRHHGDFCRDGNGCYYIDNNSTNGSYYNGIGLYPGFKRYLKNGDVIHIFFGDRSEGKGFQTMIFLTDYPECFSEHVLTVDQAMKHAVIHSEGKPVIRIDNSLEIENGRPVWDICIKDNNDGLLINNEPVSESRKLILGDSIKVNDSIIVYLGDALVCLKDGSKSKGISKRNTGVNVVNDGFSVRYVDDDVINASKKLLRIREKNVSFDVTDAIMISGGAEVLKYEFKLAEDSFKAQRNQFNSGYTNSFTADAGSLSVYDYNMMFVGRSSYSDYQTTVNSAFQSAFVFNKGLWSFFRTQEEATEAILRVFELNSKRDVLISELSPKERRELDIALAYVTDPDAIFLDEQESGLSAEDEKYIAGLLRRIAAEGRNIFVFSNDPDGCCDLFDKVLIISNNSIKDTCEVVYSGTSDEARKFLNDESLSEAVKKISGVNHDGYTQEFTIALL